MKIQIVNCPEKIHTQRRMKHKEHMIIHGKREARNVFNKFTFYKHTPHTRKSTPFETKERNKRRDQTVNKNNREQSRMLAIVVKVGAFNDIWQLYAVPQILPVRLASNALSNGCFKRYGAENKEMSMRNV